MYSGKISLFTILKTEKVLITSHTTQLDLLFCRVLYSEYTAIGAEHGIAYGGGIGITRIELDAHHWPLPIFLCKMSVQSALYCLIVKVVRFINRTAIVKTSLNVTKIQF